MNREHFEALAATLRCLRSTLSREDHKRVVTEIASTCKHFNSAFATARFLEASGVELLKR